MRVKGNMTLLVTTILLLAFRGTRGNVDPCITHKVINEPHRSSLFEPSTTDRLLCDRDLDTGWYSFGTGTDTMPTSCVQRNHCGTSDPIWMSGQLPPQDGREHPVKACVNLGYPFGKPCCQTELDIKVKNCGNGKYVYNLVRAPSCSMAYCAGDKYVCDIGNVNLNPAGGSKCTNVYPKLTQFPTLIKPTIDSQNKPIFGCKINYPLGDPNVAFDVSWTVDGKVVTDVLTGKPLIKTLTGDQREVTVDSTNLYNHINSNLRCNVSSHYLTTPNVKSDVIESNPFFVGFKTSKSRIVVDEKGPEQEFTIESTIPIPCSSLNKKSCTMALKLKSSNDPLDTSTKGCVYDLVFDPNTNTSKATIKVKATRDFLNDKNKAHLISFEKLTPTDPTQAMFYNAQVPSVNVESLDAKTAQCQATGDPHIHSLDNYGHSFGLYKTGDYVLYKSTVRPFEVQVRNWDCGHYQPCICSTIVREGNDVIQVDMCSKRRNELAAPELKVLSGKLEGATWTPKMDKTGKKFYIDFPSGTRVVVSAHRYHRGSETDGWLDVHIDAPSDDYGHTEGICGTFDGNATNDHTGRDNHVYGSDSHSLNNFENTWGIKPGSSMFDTVPPHEKQYELGKEYCTCSNTIVSCSRGSGSANPQRNHCSGGKCLQAVQGQGQGQGQGRRDVSASYNDDDHDAHIPIDPSLRERRVVRRTARWPTASGITQAKAMSMCQNALRNSTLYSRCSQRPEMNLTSMIGPCVEDIKFSDSDAFTLSHMNAYDESCKSTILSDVSSFHTDANGMRIVPLDVTDHVCYNQCSMRGTCHLGTCHCKTGWMGPDCSVQQGAVPTINRIRGDSLCDQRQHPCLIAYVIAEDIVHSDNLVCKYKTFGTNTETVIAAFFRNFLEVICPLPETQSSSVTYQISVSNDKVKFSHPKNFTVYDSKCLSCTVDGVCTLKSNTCLIDGVCRSAGEQNSHQQQCDPTKNNHAWTGSAELSQTDHYTAASDGCPCPFNTQDFSCACCQNGGCPCGEIKQNKCFACDRLDECGGLL